MNTASRLERGGEDIVSLDGPDVSPHLDCGYNRAFLKPLNLSPHSGTQTRNIEFAMTQFNATNYSIARSTGQCAMTDQPLEPGTEYIATVVEEGDELVRLDISLEAWESGQRPDQVFSYWRATVPEPNEKPKPFVDDAVLLDLLRRLADTEQPARQAFRFVLTLILMRKKLLRYDRTIEREGERPIYAEIPAEPEPETKPAEEVAEAIAEGEPIADSQAETTDEQADDSAGTPEADAPAEPTPAKPPEPEIIGHETVMQQWWILTPKLDPSKGPMSKWHPEETIEVLDPQLDELQIRQVTDQLGQILNAEL